MGKEKKSPGIYYLRASLVCVCRSGAVQLLAVESVTQSGTRPRPTCFSVSSVTVEWFNR